MAEEGTVKKAPAIIHKLDEDVVNKIAAGEVIQRPANALKEMIENSLDAGAGNIQVMVKQGGLKLLQIQDTGHGIRKEDMEIVCERFTTSKLRKFEDLSNISTYGFRGEALASISHVAHVTILTRTKESPCAFRGEYADSRLKGPVKPCAGNVGTQITVEDLFYNIPLRRKALRSPGEEHAKIADVVGKYAIHNSTVGFTLKKYGESMAEMRTPQGSNVVDNIRTIYGSSVARECLQFQHEDARLGFKLEGCVTNANYSVKRPQFLLFINHRLVDSTALRKALDQVYAAYLPKNTHPFIYLSLEIATGNVDVNVHPTKHEVHFLHEDAIIESCQKALESKLLGSNQSRTFFTQTLLPGPAPASSLQDENSENKTVNPQNLVRTDSRDQKLDAFVTKGNTSVLEESFQGETSSPSGKQKKAPVSNASGASAPERREIKLASVTRLRAKIQKRMHNGLRDVFTKYTFVGCVDKEYSLIQHQTRLYLVNLTKVTKEFFYQVLLKDFGNFGYIRLSEPAPLYELALLALECEESGWKPENGKREDLAKFVDSTLREKSEMLLDYFSIEIDEKGNLQALPLLLVNYIPQLDGLPMLILRLASEVDWEREEPCFRSICQELSGFYAMKKDPFPVTEGSDDWKWMVEHVLFPAMRTGFFPPSSAADDASILQIANLPDLYKVFERC